MKIGVETLENGMEAVFVNMPHFRTSSARLLIHSGSLHEDEATAGAAHFLEHVTFQGTRDLPTEQQVHLYGEENGVSHNAFTSQASTRYLADGYDARSVCNFVTQVALFPNLAPAALEKERNPIVDEFRGRASAPTFHSNNAHNKAIRGDRFARPVIGASIDDILRMTPENLSAYHARNYRLGNAVLVVCSGTPMEQQREIVHNLLQGKQDVGPDQPVDIVLPKFNPYDQSSSLQLVDLPPEAQTNVSIFYEVPAIEDTEQRYAYNLLGNAIAKAAHRRLRGELALCYGVNGGTFQLDNRHFGASGNWATLKVGADLNGADSIPALKSMLVDVLKSPIPQSMLDTQCVSLVRMQDAILEGNPQATADFISGQLSTRRSEIDLEDGLKVAKTITAEDLKRLQKIITDQKPLVLATSPSQTVLDQVGEWANNL